MSTAAIRENLLRLHERMAAAAQRCGRDPARVRLVAVSKSVARPEIEAAVAAGQRVFGENRVQDLQAKVPALPGDLEWHMIGHLQGNKARTAVRLAAWIHSVDSVALVQRLERVAGEEGRRPVVLLEFNVAGEASKTGAPPATAEPLMAAVLACRNLDCRGLMTMAPYDAPVPEQHRVFAALRELRDRLAHAAGTALPELSMGMSADFEPAIAEGATLVRIGTAVFGARPPAAPLAP